MTARKILQMGPNGIARPVFGSGDTSHGPKGCQYFQETLQLDYEASQATEKSPRKEIADFRYPSLMSKFRQRRSRAIGEDHLAKIKKRLGE